MQQDSNVEEKPMIVGLESLKTELGAFVPIVPQIQEFIQTLSNALPSSADPFIQSEDGTSVDVFWEDLLLITIDENSVSVGDFSSGQHQYEHFESLGREAVDHIVKSYNNCREYIEKKYDCN